MAIDNKLSNFLNKRTWIIPVLFGFMCAFLLATIVSLEIRGIPNIDRKFAFSIGGEICAMIVAIMMTVSILPTYKRQSGYIRVFVTLLTIGCFVLFLDSVQMIIDGIPGYAQLNEVVCVFVFGAEAFFIFFFWLYVTYVLKSKGRNINILNMILGIALLVFILLPFVNFFYPIYFTVDEVTGLYARNTDTWWISQIYIILVPICVVIAIFDSKESVKTKIVIAVYMALPLISIGAGGHIYGVSLKYTAMMTSLVLIYAFLFSDNERILYSKSKELGVATNIQKHMLPSIFPAFPDRKEFDIYASMVPAKEVGGDFYDFFLIDDYTLGIVIADVSDKGIPAALFMMASKIMVQNYTMLSKSPSEVITNVNKQVCSNNQEGMFVTIWLGILDLKTGKLKACNAGHEKPVIKNPDGNFELVNDKHCFVVGWNKDAKYSEYEMKLEKGSKLFIYTDGIPEASNGNERFGVERMLSSLKNNENKSPKEILEDMKFDIDTFVDGKEQFDDTTMLCLEYRGYDDEE